MRALLALLTVAVLVSAMSATALAGQEDYAFLYETEEPAVQDTQCGCSARVMACGTMTDEKPVDQENYLPPGARNF